MALIIILFLSLFSFSVSSEEPKEQTDVQKDAPKEVQAPEALLHYLLDDHIYMAATSTGNKEKTLMSIKGAQENCFFGFPLAPEKVTLNNQPDMPNPLFDQKVKFLNAASGSPSIVLDCQPNVIYYFDHVQGPSHLFSTTPLCDAQGQESAGIVALDQFIWLKRNATFICAAVKPQQGNFGDPDSGIALAVFDSLEQEIDVDQDNQAEQNQQTNVPEKNEKKEKQKIRTFFLKTFDLENGDRDGNKALRLDCSSSAIDVAHGLDKIFEHATFCWDYHLLKLYVGLHIKTKHNASEHQGAHAVVMADFSTKPYKFVPIIHGGAHYKNSPLSVFGSNQEACVHHIRAMLTSTNLSYLIVVGGKGNEQHTSRQVLALPLVNANTADNHGAQGTIAAQHCTITESFKTNTRNHRRTVARLCTEPATTQPQMPVEYNAAVLVGGSYQLPGPIEKLIVREDAVFVVIQKTATNIGGIFHSQPIFDVQGKIAAWTPWQRMGDFFGTATDAFVWEYSFNVAILQDNPKHIFKTSLSPNYKKQKDPVPNLAYVVSNLFADCGGIANLLDIPHYFPGISQQHPISFVIATGQQQIALIELAGHQDGSLINYSNDYATNYIHALDGSLACLQEKIIDQQKPVLLVCSGGALDEIGTIQCATIYTTNKQAWLVVGGSRGLAVLADEHGRGWDSSSGLGSHFQGLRSTMRFYKLGDWSFVQKIVADQEHLYILSNQKFYRFNLDPATIVHNNAKPTCLATSDQCSIIFDIGVSKSLALLATNQGIFFNATSTPIDNADTITWHKSNTDIKGQPYKFVFLTPTGLEHDFSCNGQIFVIAGSMHNNYSYIYRLFIDSHHNLQQRTCMLGEPIDQEIFHFRNFRNVFYTDGLHYLVGHPSQKDDKAQLDFFTAKTISGRNRSFLQIPLHAKKATTITAVIRNATTGKLLIAGDFGLLTHGSEL